MNISEKIDYYKNNNRQLRTKEHVMKLSYSQCAGRVIVITLFAFIIPMKAHNQPTLLENVPNLFPEHDLSEQALNHSRSILRNPTIIQEPGDVTFTKKKEWTLIIYMAADNDLANFARKNLMQLAALGSNDRVNIVVQLDTTIQRKKKVTLRYFVEENKLTITNYNDPASQQMDSGSPHTLIDCCRWAIENFPAEHYMLDLWNHGIGIIDIERRRSINPSELFTFNPHTCMVELDRTIPFLDFLLSSDQQEHRGVCFDDSTGNFLTNQDLSFALKTITHDFLDGNKLGVVSFDACLMAMLEVANVLQPYTNYMVASQEVELGTGYDYKKIIAPFSKYSLSEKEFAQHMVDAYGKTYARITNDFTQSAVELENLALLEANVSVVASLLITCLKEQKNDSVKKAIRTSRHKLLCTHFDEPSYIDLDHLYSNFLSNLSHFDLHDPERTKVITQMLREEIKQGRQLIKNTVVANEVGKNLRKAGGISIYFPERRIHRSYRKTNFAQTNMWAQLLGYYILT